MSVVGDANIDDQIATAGRVRQVVDDLDISALLARARGDPLCLIASFYLVDRGLRHRLPGCSSLVLPARRCPAEAP